MMLQQSRITKSSISPAKASYYLNREINKKWTAIIMKFHLQPCKPNLVPLLSETVFPKTEN